MDIKKYRARCEAELEKYDDSYGAMMPAQLQAVLEKKVGTAHERAEAVANSDFISEDVDKLIQSYLNTIADGSEAVVVRLSAIDKMEELAFLGPQFAPHRAEYLDVLSDLIDDPSSTLRQRAIETLAMENDAEIHASLLEGLKHESKAQVPAAVALQLLTYNDHSEAAPTVRKIFKSLDDRAKEEAIGLLSGDPASSDFIGKLLRDTSQSESLRQIAANALQSLDPEKFEKIARKIVANEDDDDNIRATCLSAIDIAQFSDKSKPTQSFTKSVAGLETRSTNFRRVIKRFLANQDKA